MAKKMLIDATHNEEIRVAVVDGNRLADFDAETSTKRQIKSNIYLAKVIRIEPSLQAAFVEFGGNRHGFLPFSEIHPDYYRIPVADRSANEESNQKEAFSDEITLTTNIQEPLPAEDNLPESLVTDLATDITITDLSSNSQKSKDPDLITEDLDLTDEDVEKISRPRVYPYKIQEVIKRRQIMLVQVVKEERGNKGAALTTYLSLPGRYCVLMPNSAHRSGGISRKISDSQDRKRLRDILKELDIPQGMSLIVRTAGQERNKLEIRRDFDYLLRLWSEIREATLKSIAPALIYAEGDLIKRTIRDCYNKDIDGILVEGEEAYKTAKNFMKMLMPSHARRVQPYRDESSPLFQKYQVETQIDLMMQPLVLLPSGGSIVINPTEALVSIDVNSGKATRERHIDDTAIKTNLEAADEIARQMRLRDLAGLIVIDFIDMSDQKHIQSVEKRLKEAVKNDRARIQLGKISQFGLLELSRQRLRPSIIEANTTPCQHCRGTGVVRSIESMALHVLRAIEAEGVLQRSSEISVTVPTGVDLYLLNQKRSSLLNIESRFSMTVFVQRDDKMIAPDFRIDCTKEKALLPSLASEKPVIMQSFSSQTEPDEDELSEKPIQKIESSSSEEFSKEDKGRRNNRRKHFTQRRRGEQNQRQSGEKAQEISVADTIIADTFAESSPPPPASIDENNNSSLDQQPSQRSEKQRNDRRRRRHRHRGGRRSEGDTSSAESQEPSSENSQKSSTSTPALSVVSSSADNESKNSTSGTNKKRRGWLKRLFEG